MLATLGFFHISSLRLLLLPRDIYNLRQTVSRFFRVWGFLQSTIGNVIAAVDVCGLVCECLLLLVFK